MASESERKTRKTRIDAKLRSLSPSWEIVPYSEGMDTSALNCHAVEEYPTANGPADYALFVKGRLLGIVEAKKLGVSPENVLEQAKRYAQGVTDGLGNWDGYHVPFLYSTNGELIFHIDVRHPKAASRQISNFHTADALEEQFSADRVAAYQRLITEAPEIERLRPYQKKAVESVENAIADGKRALLVAMATGTGKTLTTVAQVYRLLETGAARRILFLVDRRALAAQATVAFSTFNTPKGSKLSQDYEVYSQRFKREDFDEEDNFDPKVLPEAYLTKPKATHTFIYISTIQRMAINLFGKEAAKGGAGETEEEDADKLDIPVHAFDVIIADECHRGYTAQETSTWRNVLDHFDAVKIGLTATPAQHTINLFHEVVFRYTTEEAIRDGWLVDYEPVVIHSGVKINGAFLREGEQVGIIDTESGKETLDELEDEREFRAEQIEREITAPDSNRKIIQEIKKHAEEHRTATGRYPKILIFAVNDLPHRSHADQVVRLCREVFGQGDKFVQKITGSPSVDRPLKRIREFRNLPEPKIVVTVDMLSTGVDIPAIEFVVFMRFVKSRILWVQMLGRGTRRCDDIGKDHFVMFDCFGGGLIKYFDQVTDFELQLPEKEVIPTEQVIENIYQNADRDYNVKVLMKRLRRIEHNMSGEAIEKFANFIPDGDLGKFTGELPSRVNKDFVETLKILRDKNFQALLRDYPRKRPSYLVAYDVVDSVHSEKVVYGAGGYQKPEDYLVSFSRFVDENVDGINALQVLLKKPKDWSTTVLNELREKLKGNHFTEKDLQRAHQLVSHKALADIISIVKHAARKEQPLLTAAERVTNAMERIRKSRTFNEEQLKWLQLIEEHLKNNLSLDVKDFEIVPIFEMRGGLKVAQRVFGDELSALIEEINYQIAA